MIPPACMDPDELALWHEMAVRASKWDSSTEAMDPCADCLVGFSRAMTAQGRCNGIPGEARPVAPIRSALERQRENNRRGARLWRLRHPGRKRLPVADLPGGP